MSKICKFVKDQGENFSDDLPSNVLKTVINLEKQNDVDDENDNIVLVIPMLYNFFTSKNDSLLREWLPVALHERKWKSYFFLYSLLSIKSQKNEHRRFIMSWVEKEVYMKFPQEEIENNDGSFEKHVKENCR